MHTGEIINNRTGEAATLNTTAADVNPDWGEGGGAEQIGTNVV